ncbi:MAG: Transcriptional regulatory protein WalR [Syntrophorhabdaceae bacterium PtaU1.Bin034]|nr:MAG: Transcriptional regulatory protein WalR [Syntrophorhabdaceae bacterium PtaU1.Bin034]
MKILVVDDEDDVLGLVSASLERAGYAVVAVRTGEDALEALKKEKPDLVVLDLMLPGIQGLDVCRQIRHNPEYSNIPIVILSAKSSEVDRVLGFEMGADDYITKPFSVRELVHRVRVSLGRASLKPKKADDDRGTFSCKGLFVDFDKYEVVVKGRRIDLSPIAAKLLFFFAKNPGKVYTRDQLLDQVWGNEVFVTPRSVDVQISRVRKLIEQDPQKPRYIVTIANVGYKFDDSGA